jgi:hypothetical protein
MNNRTTQHAELNGLIEEAEVKGLSCGRRPYLSHGLRFGSARTGLSFIGLR